MATGFSGNTVPDNISCHVGAENQIGATGRPARVCNYSAAKDKLHGCNCSAVKDQLWQESRSQKAVETAGVSQLGGCGADSIWVNWDDSQKHFLKKDYTFYN